MHVPAPDDGEVSFLFTDVEGSTQLAQSLGDEWPEVLQQHREISRRAWTLYGGHEVDTAGDGFFVVFADRPSAVAAAGAAQRDLWSATWPGAATVRVRMGLHRGRATTYDGSYVGYEVHRAARVAAAAHGGQILATAAALDGLDLAVVDLTAVDLGHHPLKDLALPERLFQLVGTDLPRAFPPLRTLAGQDPAAAVEVPSTMRSGVDVQPGVLTLPDGRHIPLTSYGARVGRTPDNDIVLADPAVSRHHCAISATNGGFVITDLQSTHGTRVGGIRIGAPQLLGDDDVIRVGDTEMTFSWPAG